MEKKKKYIVTVAVLAHLIALGRISSVFCFTSISEQPTLAQASTHILIYSDAGYANPGEYQVAAAMAKRNAEYPFHFAISAGDNIQLKIWGSGGIIKVWGHGGMEEAFEQPFAPLIRAGIRFYAVLGNHDHQGLRQWKERSYSDRVDAVARGVGGFVLPAADYVVRRNGVKAVFLDVANAFSGLNWSEQRAKFARRELGTQVEKWQILVFHYPLWSSGEHGRDQALSDLRKVMLPILNECPVDFVITGHDHHAELFQYPGKVKTRIAIVGNTAKPHELLYKPEIPSVFRTITRGFTEIDILGNRAQLSFRSMDGAIMFREVVQK